MVLLNAFGLKKSYAMRTLFEGVSFEISENDRVGLIGINGSGKTTLVKLLIGEEQPDEGAVSPGKFTRIGHVNQHVNNDSSLSAYDEVLSVFAPLIAIEKELSALSERMENGDDAELDALVRRQHVLTARFEAGDGYTYRARTRSTLLGLGFTEDMLNREVRLLSGGEKAKVLLARMLLSGADLLLLDEPTNHLDIASVEWLEDYLLSYRGAYIVISHDRYFLDRVTNRTMEIENGRLKSYTGSYSAYMEKKSHERDIAERHYKNTMREIKRIEGIVEQQRRWNREKNIKTAESKLKEIARLEATLEKPDEAPEALRFKFDAPEAVTNEVVVGRGLAKSYDGRKLFEGLDILVKKGDRSFLLGANGSGKTTLLRILTGQVAPDAGERLLGAGVTPGYYDQTLSDLSHGKTVLGEVWDRYPGMTQTAVRTALGRFLFKGDDVFKRVEALSGGERARLSLLMLMLSGANLLLLDEPTNHLDISSREALEDALSEYTGTLLIVSHDRYFINKLATGVYYLSEEGLFSSEGGYDECMAERKRLAELRSAAKAEKKAESKGAFEYGAEKLARAEVRKLRAKVGVLERGIGAAEARMAEIERELEQPDAAADYMRVCELSEELEKLRQERDRFTDEWLELTEQLESV